MRTLAFKIYFLCLNEKPDSPTPLLALDPPTLPLALDPPTPPLALDEPNDIRLLLTALPKSHASILVCFGESVSPLSPS